MNKNHFFLFIFILFLFVSCLSIKTSEEVDYFLPLKQNDEKQPWGINNKEKANVFESIYKKNSNNKDFVNKLILYTDSLDKCYWIGIFLADDYYTNIKNIDLSIILLKKGLKLTESEQDTVRFNWEIGFILYFNNKKSEAEEYLIKAVRLSEKYPGHRPALTRSQTEEIDVFIESVLGKY